MRVWTKCEIDIETGAVTGESFEYSGPCELMKESEAEKQSRLRLEAAQAQGAENYYNIDLPWQRQMAQQQMANYQRQSASEEAYMRDYLGLQKSQYADYKRMMADQLAQQKAYLKPIQSSMQPYLDRDIGYGDSTLRLMQDQSMSGIASGYGDANAELKAALLARGGGLDLPQGGDFVRGNSELQMGLANATAGGRRQISLSNAQAALQNRFNAAGVLMGSAGLAGQNIGTAAGGAGGALSGFGAGAQGFAQAPVISGPGAPAMLAPPKPQGGFWSSLGKGLLGGTVGALTGGLVGGVGNMFSGWFKQNPSYGGSYGGGYGGGYA